MNLPARNRTVDRTVVWLGVVVILGLAYRAWLVSAFPPMTGDPTYSYCHRALLISDGDFRGLTTMWHPPGYPLLLAALIRLGFGFVPPYTWGVVVSFASYVGVTIVVDRLLAPRVSGAVPRLIAASFLAFYESSAIWAIAPLTEPVYQFVVFSAVLLLDRQSVSVRRALAAGMLLGFAFTMRFEGAAPAVGLSALMLLRRQPKALAGMIFGGVLAGGWLLTQWDYLKFCLEIQGGAYTIPAAHGVAGKLKRLVECAYYAVTQWLPYALLLPYWMLTAVGMLYRDRAVGRRSLHAALLAVVVPSILLVMTSIMHKRIGSFLLPAAAIWVALGVEVLTRRFRNVRSAAWLIPLAVILLIIGDVGRTSFRLLRTPWIDPPSYVAASILAANDAPAGRLWAFGAEPEVYAFRNQAIYWSYREAGAEYRRLYLDHQGKPDDFIAALRADGYRYLVFETCREGDQKPREPSAFDDPKVRADARLFFERAAELRLKPLGSRPGLTGEVQVHVYELGEP